MRLLPSRSSFVLSPKPSPARGRAQSGCFCSRSRGGGYGYGCSSFRPLGFLATHCALSAVILVALMIDPIPVRSEFARAENLDIPEGNDFTTLYLDYSQQQYQKAMASDKETNKKNQKQKESHPCLEDGLPPGTFRTMVYTIVPADENGKENTENDPENDDDALGNRTQTQTQTPTQRQTTDLCDSGSEISVWTDPPGLILSAGIPAGVQWSIDYYLSFEYNLTALEEVPGDKGVGIRICFPRNQLEDVYVKGPIGSTTATTNEASIMNIVDVRDGFPNLLRVIAEDGTFIEAALSTSTWIIQIYRSIGIFRVPDDDKNFPKSGVRFFVDDNSTLFVGGGTSHSIQCGQRYFNGLGSTCYLGTDLSDPSGSRVNVHSRLFVGDCSGIAIDGTCTSTIDVDSFFFENTGVDPEGNSIQELTIGGRSANDNDTNYYYGDGDGDGDDSYAGLGGVSQTTDRRFSFCTKESSSSPPTGRSFGLVFGMALVATSMLLLANP